MFNRPNSQDPAALVADFIELQCLLTENPVSCYTLRSLFSMSDDELDNDGLESSDDLSVDAIEDGIKVCEERASLCPLKYPFSVSMSSLEPREAVGVNKDIYQFLLLSTRLNMNTQKVQSGQDATKLFEELCVCVAKEYFGEHSKAMLFGTAGVSRFKDKVEDIISKLNLTSSYRTPLGTTGRQKDAAVDVLVWIPFADKKDSQMIAIGQCKTGTHWDCMLTATLPKAFFGSYFTGEPFADVERMFFVCESYGVDRWEERSRKAGIMFDRTRIMEYLPGNLDDDLVSRIRHWNQSALLCAEQSIQE